VRLLLDKLPDFDLAGQNIGEAFDGRNLHVQTDTIESIENIEVGAPAQANRPRDGLTGVTMFRDFLAALERQFVKPLGVAIEHRVFVVFGDLIAFQQLFDIVLAARVGNLVRKIRRVNERLVADDLDRERHR